MAFRPLPASTPAAEGVDARRVGAFLDALEGSGHTLPRGLVVLRHGRVVAQGTWAPRTPERPQLLYSLSKSFTSAAAGLAVADGLLDLDATVLSYFPELDSRVVDPRGRAMLVRHIAAMASGHTGETWGTARADREEPVRGFLNQPPQREPGTVFAYNQSNTYTLGAIVQRLAGTTLLGYLRPRLLDPLGIGPAAWEADPLGRELGFSGLYATTDAVARLGQLHLAAGRWEGRELLPPAWVAEATRRHVANGTAPDSDWEQGYGFQFWMSRHGYRGDGAYGQFCLVLPEQDAVVALTSESTDMRALLALVWEHLLPAFTPQGGAPPAAAARDGDDEELRARLAALALPPGPGAAAPVEPAEDWAAAPFSGAGDTAARALGVTAARLAAVPGGWELLLETPEGKTALRHDRPGPHGWSTAERPSAPVPLAFGGGWTGPGAFTATLLPLEVPHSMTVTLDLSDRTLAVRPRTIPLHGTRLAVYGAPLREDREIGGHAV
ncbi:serine hydrolase domain-containing protein [Actinacidiphila yeochonensis]|uniref:serine hydrolase domain-containing protein n=1 Tax=Actinacidiphila yeochonensis TaxID=89050 RepID=UPI0006917529|nr:serine hydrolase domain-containing protein [Actinacidiphila yeochonensis]